jgi:hypothetical protein
MGSTLDLILNVIGIALLIVLAGYYLMLFYRYRNDPVKREWLLARTQVFPERIRRFIEDADYNEKHAKPVPPTSGHKRSTRQH